MQNNVGGYHFSSVLNGLIWAFLISIVLSVFVTFILHFTAVSESLLPAFATLIFFLSILIGSLVSAKSAGNKGLIHGLSIGGIYLIITLILSAFFVASPFAWLPLLKKIVYTVVASSIGGIIGIGLTEN